MPRKPRLLPHVKVVRAKGKEYLYFNTGTKDQHGKLILKPLPPRSSEEFATKYAAALATRTKRQAIAALPTLAECIRAYYRSKEFAALKAGSQKTYLVYLRKLEDEMGVAPPDEFTSQDVLALLDSMKPQAANMMRLVIKNVYAFARPRGMATTDPAGDIADYEGGEFEPWPEDLLDAALAEEDALIRVPVALLYYTAQRIGDVCKIRWTDIERNEAADCNEIYVQQQKTGKELWIRVHSALQAELDKLPRSEGDVVDINRTLLADSKGRPAKTETVRARLQRWAKERGHTIVPHGLRKNAVNALLEAGCSVGQTSSISGQSLALVEHYAKKRNSRKMGSAAILKWEANRK